MKPRGDRAKAWRRELEQYRAEPVPVTVATPAAPSKVWPDLRKRKRQSNAVASLPVQLGSAARRPPARPARHLN
jgi:hypothetical protein